MDKQEAVSIIKKGFGRWSQIENPDVLTDFLEWVESFDQEEWKKNNERVQEIINDYNEQARKYDPLANRTASQYTEEDVREIKKQSELQQKFTTNKKKFIELFSYHSVHNEDIARIMYHALISLLCIANDTQIRTVNGKKIVPLTHNFVIQSSGSGKDQALDFFNDFVGRLNNKIAGFNQETGKNGKKLSGVLTYEWSGTESPESLLDGFEMGKDGKPKMIDDKDPVPVDGILSKYDLITASECSFLFKSNISSGRLGKNEIMLLALEGRDINKQLVSWRVNGIQYNTNTVFNGVFVGVSRPIADMKAHLAYSGLQQRGLNICRTLDEEDRDLMDKKLKELRKMTNDEWDNIDNETDKLVDEFVELSLFLKENKPSIDEGNREEIADLIHENFRLLRKSIKKAVNTDEQAEILQTFASRFHHHINILAFHNAVSRKSKKITLEDFQNGLSLLETCFEYLKEWVRQSIAESYKDSRRRQREQRRLQKFYKYMDKAKFVERTKLIEVIKRIAGVKTTQAYHIRNKWLDDCVIEKAKKDGKKGYQLPKSN